jgi:hypothetical protein
LFRHMHAIAKAALLSNHRKWPVAGVT